MFWCKEDAFWFQETDSAKDILHKILISEETKIIKVVNSSGSSLFKYKL